MARQGVDRAAIAEAAYALAEERGLAGLGIRSVAEACGVSVGTNYNYFPTKDDLLVEVIGTFWQRAFHEDLCLIVEGERFDAFVSRVYAAMSSALAAFRSDWLPQISALSIQGRDEGKMRESATFDHIRAGMRGVLEADAQADPARAGVEADELVAFALESMIAGLCAGEPDCRVLSALLRAALYGPAAPDAEGAADGAGGPEAPACGTEGAAAAAAGERW